MKGNILSPNPKYFKIFLKLNSKSSFCWIRYMFMTNKIIIDKETSELIMLWSLIKLATAIIIQIKLNDKLLFLLDNSENLMISKTAKQFKKYSSDITYWFKTSWMYKEAIANNPMNIDLYIKKKLEKR